MSEPRAQVSAVLRAAGAPMTAADVASSLDVHVTTARFHLRKLVDSGQAATVTLHSETVGRPRVGYVPVAELKVDALLDILIGQLGATAELRELAGAAAGRKWACASLPDAPVAEPLSEAAIPDPVTVTTETLGQLGFRVSGVMSAFGNHTIKLCSCPLRQVGTTHPEVARGIARGVIEHVLETASPALGGQYEVRVEPAPRGDCEITLHLSRVRAAQAVRRPKAFRAP